SAAESPTEATTHIWLISQNDPGAGATVALSSTDTSEGTVLSGTGSGSATIDTSNYATMVAGGANQIVMTHKDELILDGSQNWTVTTAGSGGTISYNTADINATTTDNEQLYYKYVSGSTKEADGGVTATISICLGSNNASSVEIAAACSGDECGGVTPGTVTFAPGSAITAAPASDAACATDVNRQTFTVTGADDLFADGTQTFSVNLTETGTYADATYDGQNPGSSGNINNADNETPGKAVYPLPVTVRGEFTAAGVNGADDICNSNKPGYAPSGTYKALIISNSGGELLNDRLATTDGSTSAGDPNWTLKADYYYYRCDGSGYSNCSDEHKRLFKANSAALIPFPMDRYFSSNSGHIFWTGMNANMTPATQTMTPAGGGLNPVYGHNCSGFTYINQPLSPNATYYGQTWSDDAGSGNITSNTNIDCNTFLRLICVQQ
ncbi:MAG: DUF1554 domain-containing protein, partial [Leptospiraceae bacterium]|nr:DUF1554 domain-containing protein [Leptospiraceae bacterium]